VEHPLAGADAAVEADAAVKADAAVEADADVEARADTETDAVVRSRDRPGGAVSGPSRYLIEM
jgi:hypothetical protein